MRFHIEPDSRVEGNAIHHECIAVPSADRMPVPSRVRVARMAAAVEVNLMKSGTFVIRYVNQKILALDELPQRTVAQRGRRQATRLWAVLGVGIQALFLDRNRGGEKLRLAWIHGIGIPPDAGEIGFTAISAGRWAGRRMVALVVRSDPQTIFAQRVELRGVAEANVELEGQRRFDDHAFHDEWFQTGHG